MSPHSISSQRTNVAGTTKKASTPLDGVTNEVAAVSLAENCRLVGLLCEVIQSVDLLRDAASTRVSFLFFVFLPH